MIMINEISRSLPGVTGGQPRSGPGKVTAMQESGLVRGASKVESVSRQKTETPAPVDEKQLNEIVDELNGFAQTVQRQLEFSLDEDNGDVIVKVVDARTREVVREIPPEEIREMQKRLGEITERLFQKDEKTALLFHGKA
jgi:flagellar protein FlaG